MSIESTFTINTGNGEIDIHTPVILGVNLDNFIDIFIPNFGTFSINLFLNDNEVPEIRVTVRKKNPKGPEYNDLVRQVYSGNIFDEPFGSLKTDFEKQLEQESITTDSYIPARILRLPQLAPLLDPTIMLERLETERVEFDYGIEPPFTREE